jgi:hypothetical protein
MLLVPMPRRPSDLEAWRLREQPYPLIRRARSRWHPPTPWTSSTPAWTTPRRSPPRGLLPAATLAERLGIEQTADALIDLAERAGPHRPGRKLLTLVHTMLAGGDGIDDADLLGCGATSRVLGHRVMAPSTVGTFLPAFTFGHVRQLDRRTEQVLARRGRLGRAPVMGR